MKKIEKNLKLYESKDEYNLEAEPVISVFTHIKSLIVSFFDKNNVKKKAKFIEKIKMNFKNDKLVKNILQICTRDDEKLMMFDDIANLDDCLILREIISCPIITNNTEILKISLKIAKIGGIQAIIDLRSRVIGLNDYDIIIIKAKECYDDVKKGANQINNK